MLYPSFKRQKLSGALPKFVNGAAVYPTIDTLPGVFYTYTEVVHGKTKAENQYIEHWCYSEWRGQEEPELVPIVCSVGWHSWMFNMSPAICDPVAYHVNLVKARCDQLQAERMEELDEIRAQAKAVA